MDHVDKPITLTIHQEKPSPGQAVLTPQGEVDVYTSPDLKAAITAVVEGGARCVVINLDQVEYLDSTGLGVLIGGQRRAEEAGGQLKLVCTHKRHLRLLEMTRLQKVFEVHAGVQEALG